MDAYELANFWADKMEWAREYLLLLVLEYIQNQRNNAAFEDFLMQKAVKEDEWK